MTPAELAALRDQMRYDVGLGQYDCARLFDEIARLRRALEAAKRKHIRTADGNYVCPAGARDGDRCNCGADRHNAAIDAALRGEE